MMIRLSQIRMLADRGKSSSNGKQPSIGSGTAELGSVSVVLDLGGLPSGMPAGKLLFQTENIGPTTYTPAALQKITLSADVEVLPPSGNIRQIYTWDGLADIQLVAGGFAVRFYSLDDVEDKQADGYRHSGLLPVQAGYFCPM